MTELQLGLLVIGAVVVAGVFAYNRLQERGAQRAAERAFRSAAGDALLDENRPHSEPVMSHAAPPAPRRSTEQAQEALPDARIDYIVELSFAEPRAPAELLEYWKPHAHRYVRRALLAYSPDGAQWLLLQPGEGAPAQALRAGLQLVTREGAIGEAAMIEFRAAVEALAAAAGASVSAPEMRQAVEQARELDQFCADADLQVVFHVMPPRDGVFAGEAVRRAAQAAGLTLGDDGRFALRDETAEVLFSLGARDGPAFSTSGIDASAPPGLTIMLDVPRAPGTQRAFRAMAAFARQLAASLEGTLVDDNERALDDRSLAAIGAQLSAVQASFAARGIEPGSAAALRLFA